MEKLRFLPIVFVRTYFVPLKNIFTIELRDTKSINAIRALANGKSLQRENDADVFVGNIAVVLNDGESVNTREEVVSSLRNYYSGLAMEARIMSCRVYSENRMVVQIQSLQKISFTEFLAYEPYFLAKFSVVSQYGLEPLVLRRLWVDFQVKVKNLVRYGCSEKYWFDGCVDQKDSVSAVDWIIARFNTIIPDSLTKRELQDLFCELSVSRRWQVVLDRMDKELARRQLETDLNQKVSETAGKQQREYMLRQRLKAVQEELKEFQEADSGDEGDIVERLRKRVEEACLPPSAQEVADRALRELSDTRSENVQAEVTRNFLDHICDYPWNKSTEDNYDLINARRILDEDHYGLEKVKKRIIEYLAVRKLNPNKKGAIICLDGPPGTGKTSIAKSIARALGRKFFRISLGGIDDEAKVRGHRRTYIGAFPGCIIKAMISVGVKNPVIDLDEVDKIKASLRGDPSGALLEVLDPEQNNSFSDHYFGPGVEVDLSQVIFICTSNYKENILPTLRDRMEFIDFPGYTRREKLEIAKRHLLPEQLEENGLSSCDIRVNDKTLEDIIVFYTQESGVRTLKRTIADVLRSRAINIAQGESYKKTICPDELLKILGPIKTEPTGRVDVDDPGIITGLVWTPVGGETLIIESCKMKKKGAFGELQYTGHMGPSMSESVEVAFTCARRYLAKHGIDTSDVKEKYDIHLHVPEGAVSKDGPSAGGAMTIALISLLSGKRVRPDMAMTGEIFLRENGTIGAIGGLKEKLLAAHQAGYKHVVIPKRNEANLVEIPEEVRRDLHIVLAEHIEEVAEFALLP
ncbi:MAG: endopeptidase La [Patescibacteria group bacterium]